MKTYPASILVIEMYVRPDTHTNTHPYTHEHKRAFKPKVTPPA